MTFMWAFSRPLDLVVLDVRAVGLRVDPSSEGGPTLVHVDDGGGQLIVTLPFQHLGEQAWLEELGPIAATELADHRAARPSRLAFDVPAGTTIPFSSQGILAAIRTLALRVVPAAQQRATFGRPRLRDLLDVLELPGGVVFGRHGDDFVVTRRRGRAAEMGALDLLAASTTMRQVRLRVGAGAARACRLECRTSRQRLDGAVGDRPSPSATGTGAARRRDRPGSALAAHPQPERARRIHARRRSGAGRRRSGPHRAVALAAGRAHRRRGRRARAGRREPEPAADRTRCVEPRPES